MDQVTEALGHAVSPRILLPLEHWVSDVVAGHVVGAVAVAVGDAIVGNIAGMRG